MTADAEMISFACGTCGQPFLVPAHYAGRQATCRNCGEIVVVPATSQPASNRIVAPPTPRITDPSNEPDLGDSRAGGPVGRDSDLTQYEMGMNGTIYYADPPKGGNEYADEEEETSDVEQPVAAGAASARPGLLTEQPAIPAHMAEAELMLRRALERSMAARETIHKDRETLAEQERVIARQARLAADAKERARAASLQRRAQFRIWRWRVLAGIAVIYLLLAAMGRIGDWLMLSPSTEPMLALYMEHHQIPTPAGVLEMWTDRTPGMRGEEPEAFVLCLCGNDQRAENAAAMALDHFVGHKVEVWALNYPGFGGSSGRASLDHVIEPSLSAFDVVWHHAREAHSPRPIFIVGQNLGADAALYVASKRRNIAGLVLYAPASPRQLLLEKYGWFNLWLIAGPVSLRTPSELNAIEFAAKCNMPALFIEPGRDSQIPVSFQQRVADAYAGEKKVFEAPFDGHNGMATGPALREAGEWLWKRVMTPNSK